MPRRASLAPVLALLLVALACATPAPRPAADAPGVVPASASAAAPPAAGPPVAAPAGNERLRALIDAAREEGALDIVWGENTLAGAAGIDTLVRAVNSYYGLDLKVQYTPGPSQPQVAAQLVQEFAAGRRATTDVYIGGSESYIATLISPTMTLEQVDWAGIFDHINPSFVAANGAALQISSRLPGIVYNTQLIPPSEAPRTMQALLDPKWKGKISTQAYLGFFDTLSDPDIWGMERTRQYVTAYAGQVAGLIRCGEYERVASGEYWINALACTEGGVRPFINQGAPLGYIVPEDAGVITHRYLAVPKHARHPNAATLFVAFFLTPQGQQFLWDVDYEDHHGVPGTHNYQVVQDLKAKGMQFVDVSVEREMSFPVLENAAELQKIIQQ
ncbi:MAG TPA: ABC transporter substrate-binding protein [Chloroflexota bacterium]|jgi:iron(III) transport system substrate-binding protein